MPTRMLREGILTSFQVNALSQGAELFYRRLMSVVDDFGCFEAHPTILLAKCYPLQLDHINIEHIKGWLAECGKLPSDDGGLRSDDGEPLPLVSIYTVNGKKYLQINKFGQRERSPKYPQRLASASQVPAVSGDLPQDAAYARATTTPSPANTPAASFSVNGHGNWKSDSTFTPFIEAYNSTGKALIDADWSAAYFEWRVLDMGQKLEAVKGVHARVKAGLCSEPQFVHLPKNYLAKHEWERPVVKRKATTHEELEAYWNS